MTSVGSLRIDYICFECYSSFMYSTASSPNQITRYSMVTIISNDSAQSWYFFYLLFPSLCRYSYIPNVNIY